MKKLIGLAMVILIVFSFVGCGTKETTKTEEELKAEIRAELEAEAKEENNDTKVEQVSIDLQDKNLLLDFLCENFNPEMKMDDLNTVYGDFNNDGNEDVACYSPNRNNFYEVAFITINNGELSFIPSDIEKETIYTHDITFDGKFIHYTITGGGTGISTTLERLYVYDGNKIKYTGADFVVEAYTAQPPTSNYPDGYMTETTSNTIFDTEGDYSNFVHELITTGSVEETEKKSYEYNPDTHDFTITDL